MKKRLLMQLLAFVCAAGAYAFNVGDYVYTENARLKIAGANQVENSNFSSVNTNGWFNAEGAAVSVDVFSVMEGLGPNGENVIVSQGATEGNAFCGRWSLDPGTYVVSFDVKAATATNSSVTNYTVKDNVTTYSTPNNYFDVFINMDGSFTKVPSTEEMPVIGVATATYMPADWRTVSFVATIQADQQLVLHFEKLVTETMFTNISIHKVTPVYDVRPLENKISYVKELMDDPNFNVAEAAGARSALADFINGYDGFLASGEIDDESAGEEFANMLDEYIEDFLGVTSVNLVSLIPGLDIASLPFAGRGRDFKAYANGLDLLGGNWGHLESEANVLRSAIQTGISNSATYNAFHVDLPAGKYFFSAEIRNANTGKSSWPTEPVFTLATEGCKMFIANDSIDLPTIEGEEYQRFYMITEVAEDGQFRAGVIWPGLSSGGAFFIRNTMARAFNPDVEADVLHVQAFKKFIEQWNAATNSRRTLIEMQSDDNYPWSKQTLADAREMWDPYYKNQLNKQWVTEDGKDAGVATTDELNDWALYQGVELYSEPDGEGQTTRLEYQVVRGYQNAIKAVVADNQPFTDLADAIDNAKELRNRGTNVTGDRDAFKDAIEKAIATIKEVRSTTTDATREADTKKLQDALAELQAAQEAFLGTVSGKETLADIDFSNNFEQTKNENEEDVYVIKGTVNQMEIPLQYVQMDNAIADWNYALGYNGELNDVLHVGGATGSYAIVKLPAAMTDEDVLQVNFDLWYGELGKGFMNVDLLNASGVRVAGFSYDSYNNSVSYNDFNNDANTGMDIKDKVKHNHDKGGGAATVCTEALTNSFELIVDYLNGNMKGKFVNSDFTVDGEPVEIPMPADEDNKIAAFQISASSYQKANSSAYGRRCWFDNLKIAKLVAGEDQEEDIADSPWAPKPTDVDYDDEVDGIRTIIAEKYAGAIYSISGQKLSQRPVKGIYIQNGKKFVVK